jgi:hypothetical protein
MKPLPAYLAQSGYRNPQNPRHLPFNDAFGPDMVFEWLPKHPEVLGSVQEWMIAQRNGHTSWLDFYPLEEQVVKEFNRKDSQAVLLVDIGGSMGQDILDIRHRYLSLPGRMILQDLPSTIDKVVPGTEMEAMAHDFFTPQPIKGKVSNTVFSALQLTYLEEARVYYLSSILHDWNDEKCRTILEHIVAAMKPGYSKVLVNELLISDRAPTALAMRSDMMVMALAGGMERTERQWRSLLGSVGLHVDRIYTADPDTRSIIEASIA